MLGSVLRWTWEQKDFLMSTRRAATALAEAVSQQTNDSSVQVHSMESNAFANAHTESATRQTAVKKKIEKSEKSFSRTSSPLIIFICSETKVNRIYDHILYRLPFFADVVWLVGISLARITMIVDCVASLSNWISANTMID